MIELYLSHPFAYRHQALRIEKRLEKNLDIELRNPFYQSFEKKHIEELDRQKQRLPEFRIEQLKMYGKGYFTKIVEKDLESIRETDGTLTLVPKAFSIGTFMEVWYAHSIGKPVFIIVYPKAGHHPWLQYCASQLFTSVPDFEEWWKSEYR